MRKANYRGYTIFENGDIIGLRSFKKLSPGINSSGYRTVRIYCKNGNKNELVHRIVASLFIENPYKKPCVNHIDGDRLNNSVENLEWCYQSENIQHSYRIGLRKTGKGLRVLNTKTGKIYKSIQLAAEDNNIKPATLWYNIKKSKVNKTLLKLIF